jgi:hypothetical protein
MALESTKDFIRKEIRDNLEGFAMDHLDLQTEKEIHDFIESQKDTIEKAAKKAKDNLGNQLRARE